MKKKVRQIVRGYFLRKNGSKRGRSIGEIIVLSLLMEKVLSTFELNYKKYLIWFIKI